MTGRSQLALCAQIAQFCLGRGRIHHAATAAHQAVPACGSCLDALLNVRFREGFITPPPSGVGTLDVEQELRHWPPVGRQEAYGLTDAPMGGIPWFRVFVEEVQLPELVVKPELGQVSAHLPGSGCGQWPSDGRRISCGARPHVRRRLSRWLPLGALTPWSSRARSLPAAKPRWEPSGHAAFTPLAITGRGCPSRHD